MHVHYILYNLDVGRLDFEKGCQAEKKNKKVYF